MPREIDTITGQGEPKGGRFPFLELEKGSLPNIDAVAEALEALKTDPNLIWDNQRVFNDVLAKTDELFERGGILHPQGVMVIGATPEGNRRFSIRLRNEGALVWSKEDYADCGVDIKSYLPGGLAETLPIITVAPNAGAALRLTSNEQIEKRRIFLAAITTGITSEQRQFLSSGLTLVDTTTSSGVPGEQPMFTRHLERFVQKEFVRRDVQPLMSRGLVVRSVMRQVAEERGYDLMGYQSGSSDSDLGYREKMVRQLLPFVNLRYTAVFRSLSKEK